MEVCAIFLRIEVAIYRVIHKPVKHLKNSQQMHHSTDLGSSYADRETLQVFFTYFTAAQCVHLW